MVVFGHSHTPFNEVIGPNIRGLYNIYEAARHAKARVVFASSNHTVGFHRRDEVLDTDCTFRPDGYYGLSKCYGELMGDLYFAKHGVEPQASSAAALGARIRTDMEKWRDVITSAGIREN